MPQIPLTVLLVEDNPEYARLVQQWLAPAGGANGFLVHRADTLEGGLRRLAQGGVDVILLDLGLPDSDGAPTFTAVQHLSRGIPLIILSGDDDELLALQMIQRGAEDYLVKSAATADLLVRAVRYAVIRRQSRPSDRRAGEEKQNSVIGLMGSAGGVGTTTVACVLAADLRHLTDQPVLLADLDLRSGMVAVTCGVPSEHSVVDAVRNIKRLDRELWNGLVTRRSGELDVLAAPGRMEEIAPDCEAIRQVFHNVKRYYDWMVLDLGRLDRVSASVVEWCTKVLVVTTHNVPCLHQCKKTIDALGEQGIRLDQIGLVVNRRDEQNDLSDKDRLSLFGVEVLAVLPPAMADLRNAARQQRLPAISSPFRKTLTAAARQMAGLPEERSSPLLRPLTSIADRFRRSRETEGQQASR